VGQDDRKRLSIWEQTLFPFQSMIDAYKARRGASGATGGLPASGALEPGDIPDSDARTP